jgi:hypothetical protein
VDHHADPVGDQKDKEQIERVENAADDERPDRAALGARPEPEECGHERKVEEDGDPEERTL